MSSAGGRGRFEPLMGSRVSVVRPRLLDRLRGRFTTPVVVLAAPAGFGKTTLLAQALAENRLAPDGDDAWLTCTAEDATAASMSHGLCRAVGAPSADRPQDAVAAVTEAIWHRSPREVALVLDDVHEVPPASPGADVLTTLLAELPRNGHLVLAGRQPPPLPLGRIEVQGHVVRLGEADLSFTDEELAEFAAQRDVPGEQLADCGGWPALIELAASTASGVEADYLWEEVLAGISPDRRRDLGLLAHVGPFDEDLAAAVLDHPVDVSALTADLPLVGHTAEGEQVIHSLWRPFLAQAVTSDEVAEARRRAGLTLATAGDVPAAIRLLAQAEAWPEMTRVVVDSLGAAHPPVPADIAAGWRDVLPDELQAAPVGRLLAAVGAARHEPVAAVAQLKDAMEGFRREDELDGSLACAAQLGMLAWWWEQPDQIIDVATHVIGLEAAGYDQAVPMACLARALVYDVANDSPRAMEELDRIPPGSFNENWQSLVDWLRSLSLNHLGRPAEALEAAERACAHPAPMHAPLMEAARLQARWFLGHVEEVLPQLVALVDRIEATALGNYGTLIATTCCTGLAMAGRDREAASFLERARHNATTRDIPLVDINLATAEAALAVASDDEPRATAVLTDYLSRAPLLGPGHAAAPQQRSLALWYVLVPETRPVWEAAPLGPAFAQARALARALVAVRAGEVPERPSPLPTPGAVRSHLPLRWSTELALAEISAGRSAGWTLLESLWPAAQPTVRAQSLGERALTSRPARAALARLPVPPRGHLELQLLGPVELRRDGELVEAPEWRRERVRSLLAHLVLHRPVSRDRLGADLWPNLDAESESRNLRVTLTYLLRVLEPDRTERDASFLVRPHGNGLMLWAGDQLSTDVWQFDELWEQASEADQRGAPSLALDPMQQAVALWRGDPSELAAEEWALPEVEARRRRVVELATRAGELLLARGDPEEARRMGLVALDADPWSERAHRVVIGAHSELGDHAGAQRALNRYHAAMAELGLVPSAR